MKTALAFFLVVFANLCFSQNLGQSIQSISTLTDSLQVDSMVRLSRQNAMEDNFELGLSQARWALKKAQSLSYKDLIPKARFYIGRNFNQGNNNDSAIFHYKLGLLELKNTKSEGWEIYFINALANNYRQLGAFNNALDIQLNAIKRLETELDSTMIAKVYTELGYTYDRMRDYEAALSNHRKALQYLNAEPSSFKYFILSRVAIAHDDLGNYDSAFFYNYKALQFELGNGDSAQVGVIASNMGNTFLKQKMWDKAENFLKRATRLNLIHGDYGNKAISLINLGNVQIEKEEYKNAEKSLRDGLKYAKAWNNSKYVSEAYQLKSRLYEKTGLLDSALYYFKEFKIIEDSLYNIEKINQINELKTRFETEKKQQQIENQEISLAQQASKLEAKQRTILALVILSILIAVISVALYKRFQAKKNAETQQAIISEQEKGLKAVLHAQEEERKRIAKDLHDGVGQQLSGLKMAFQRITQGVIKTNPDKKAELELLSKVITESADEVRSISHQMMPRALSELGLIPAIEDMLKKSLSPNNFKYEFEQFGIGERLPENIEISLFRILQELINNIIKHSKANHVSIQLLKNNQKIIMIVEDNGEGFKSNPRSKGHGLLNIKSRLNTVHGEFNYEPSPRSGTTATIRIPLV